MGETEQGQGDTVPGHPGPSWWPVRTDAQFWHAVRQDPEGHGFNAEQAEKLSVFFMTGGRKEQTAEQRAGEVIGWYDATLDAEHWLSLANISPEHAAMLLCQVNPNTDGIAAASRITNDETGPQDFMKLRQRLEDLASSEPRTRNLRDWFDAATAHRLKHHSWIVEYLEAVRVVAVPEAETSSLSPATAEATPAGITEAPPASGRSTWFEVAKSYIVSMLRSKQFATAKDLYRELEAKAGSDGSPFSKGADQHRDALYLRELRQPVRLKTVQNRWRELRDAADQR